MRNNTASVSPYTPLKDLVLHGIGVLELVDERGAEATPYQRRQLGAARSAQGLGDALQQIVEREQSPGLLATPQFGAREGHRVESELHGACVQTRGRARPRRRLTPPRP